ncbi:MAG: FAD-binding oxidoreductase [Candidatus Nanopelagicales bacterium]
MTVLTGWGRTSPSTARVVVPTSDEDVSLTVEEAESAIARGLGRSYGDPAQNAGGTVISSAGLNWIGPPGPVMELGAGVSIDDLLRVSVPAGWFVPVTPGTRFVTMGGAFAADIHGKNHHREGSFSRHVQSLTMLLADGTEVTVRPQDPLFDATAGGMGLTGLITSLRLRMLPIQTSRMLVTTTRTPDLDSLLAAMLEADEHSTYSVAWVDTLASGASLGRAVLTTGEHAPLSDLSRRAAENPLAFAPRQIAGTPDIIPNWALNRRTVRAFNEVWYRKAPASPHTGLQSIAAFFHPLDSVHNWNRIYGRRGFLQYQFVVENTDVVRHALERVAAAGCPAFLAVLKRFGAQNTAPLSFPMNGWTLALDVPTTVPGLAQLLDRLDREVVDAGGRVYLAKDSRLDPSLLAPMYPGLPEFRRVRDEVDPGRRWRSDMSERLGL